ncbi:unnamed protein product [Calypogeia fissa]
MDNHRRKHHAHVDTAVNPNSVQCLVRGVGRHYFAVRCSSDPPGNVDMDSRLLKLALSKSIADIEQKLQPDQNPPAKELSPWLRVSRWSTFAVELIPEEASYDAVKGAMLLSSAVDESPYSRLPDVMRLYANKVREVGSNISYNVACMVMAFESTRGFTQFLRADTMHKYSQVMSAFVLTLLRSACDPSLADAVQVVIAPDYLRDDLVALKRQLVHLQRDPIREDGFDYAVLHRVLLGLWTPPCPARVSAGRSVDFVFLQFMILHSIVPNPSGDFPLYAWHHVSETTQMLSMLKYWCRACIEMEIARTQWRSGETDMDPPEAEELLRYVDERPGLLETPFGYVCAMQRLACTIVGDMSSKPQLTCSCPDHTWCSINGYRVSIDQFRGLVKVLIRDCTRLMWDEVLMGLDTSWILRELERGTIVDELNRTHVGYSFATNERNKFQEHRHDLLNHLFTDGATSSHFTHGVDDTGNILWKKKSMRGWKASTDKLAERLVVLFHFVSGQPPRPVEELYLQYFCIVRPAEVVVAGELWGAVSAALYRDCLFVRWGKRCGARHFSNIVESEFFKHCNAPFRIRQYRHLAKFFCEPIRAQNKAIREEALDASAGHSAVTAGRLYAQNINDLRSIGRDRWRDFHYVATKWQELLHLAGPTLEAPHPNPPPTTMKPGLTTINTHPNVRPEFPVQRIRVCHPCDSGSVSRYVNQLDGVDPGAMHKAQSALSALDYTDWKTPHQAIAAAVAVDNISNLLTILPTGSGKTAIFQLAALSSGKTVVVIVPLFLLLTAHLAHCRAANIRCDEFRTGHNIATNQPPQLVFVSFELAILKPFQDWARQLISKDKLHSIVIDEVHEVLCPFRHRNMSQLFTLSMLNCQMIGFMASLPPHKENSVRLHLGKDFKVVRSAITQPNLEYGVIETEHIDSEIACLLATWMLAAVPEDRALVYCMTKNKVEALHCYLQRHDHRLGQTSSFLYSTLTLSDRVDRLSNWEAGRTKIMLATGVIGCGYDYPSIRLVIHRGSFYSLEDYHQQSGRGGRDGGKAVCRVVSNLRYREGLATKYSNPESPVDPRQREQTLDNLKRAHGWIKDRVSCRRHDLHLEMDGTAQACVLIPEGTQCDVCVGRSMQPCQGRTSSHRGPPDLADFAEGQTVAFIPNLEAVQMEANMRTDIADLCLVRDHAGYGGTCLLCWQDPQSNEYHAAQRCPLMRGLCLRCSSRDHRASECDGRITSGAFSSCCYICFFQFEQINGAAIHRWLTNDRSTCKDVSGERIQLMIWHSYRTPDICTHLRRLFPRMPLEAPAFEPWLLSKEQGRMLNNFVRVAAAIMRIKLREDQVYRDQSVVEFFTRNRRD